MLDIVEEILAADGPRANWRIGAEVSHFLSNVSPRSYCCQYHESDYAFITRLLTEEGIGFYFEETDETDNGGSRHRPVLFSDSTLFANEASAAMQGGIRFHRQASTEQQDTIQTLGSRRTLQTATTTIATWDYKAKRVIAATLPTAHEFSGPNAPHVEN